MLIVDIILVALFLGFIGAGWKDGFIHTLGRFVGAVLGFLAARAWYAKLVPLIAIGLPKAWATILAFVVIFLLATRIVAFLFRLLDGLFRIISIIPFLKTINALLGAVLGFFEGFVILGGVLYLLGLFPIDPRIPIWVKGSTIAPYIQIIFHRLLSVLL